MISEPSPVEVRKAGYLALDALLDQAETRIEAAEGDDMWVTHFMIWLSLHRLKFGPDQEDYQK